MIDITWKVFSQTGNIETYLLMKELENEPNPEEPGSIVSEELTSLDTK
ncbi:YqzL family protein [Virgibacillus profundi]|uniref:YqzL family protein n=1 Tax=Virgibacillus profundi TaxID=2024555 RepID=A0A2A2ICP0_9BACI|nr:YqzL family protein [Virgibacillus profundi]PAV29034.1 YqzL family protein [Virgibacillus profundi]PXY53203.1 YqzL family protein [Virgibacillus profundi]